jgi:predicted nucleotidyltransferase
MEDQTTDLPGTPQAAATSDPIGATEAALVVGVHRANFVRDWASRPDFPAPIGRLARGRLWERDAVRRYAQEHGPGRGVALGSLPLSADAASWIPTIKRRIVRGFRPLRIVVFGSQANGGARPDSDIDLLVVMPDGTDERATALAIRAALHDLPVSKDVVVRTPARIRRYADIPGTLLHEALKSGATVYVRP